MFKPRHSVSTIYKKRIYQTRYLTDFFFLPPVALTFSSPPRGSPLSPLAILVKPTGSRTNMIRVVNTCFALPLLIRGTEWVCLAFSGFFVGFHLLFSNSRKALCLPNRFNQLPASLLSGTKPRCEVSTRSSFVYLNMTFFAAGSSRFL